MDIPCRVVGGYIRIIVRIRPDVEELVYLLLAAEDALCHIAVERIDRMSLIGDGLVPIDRIRPVHVHYLVLDEGNVSADIVEEIPASGKDRVPPSELKLHSAVPHGTDIVHGGIKGTDIVRKPAGQQEILGVAYEEIGSTGEAVIEEAEIYTEIVMFGNLPPSVHVLDAGHGRAGGKFLLVTCARAERIAEIRVHAGIYGHGEQIRVHAVITEQAPAETQLQKGYIVHILQPVLLIQLPRYGY